jgi:hypothetical protein
MEAMGYSARLHGADCEIALYGDSSALHGLDPATITAATGLSACNIAETGPVEDVVGTEYPLDTYLRHNKRPRYLVMMFTPAYYAPYRAPFTRFYPQGVLYAVKYGDLRKLALGLLRHPTWMVHFSVWAGQNLVERVFTGLQPTPGPAEQLAIAARFDRETHQGYIPYPHGPETSCVRDTWDPSQRMVGRFADGLAAMRQRYATGGTQVFVEITPAAACSSQLEEFRRDSDGLHDNAFQTLPIHDFAEGDVHLTDAGAQIVSRQVAAQILAAMPTPRPAH